MTDSIPEDEPLVAVHCDLCGADDSKLRYQLQQTSIVSCRECGFSYISPRIPSTILRERLQEWAVEDVVDETRLGIAFDPATLKLYGRYLDRLEHIAGRGSRRLLDVGCSTGAFLTVARTREWKTEGLELGRASVDYGRNELGLTIHNDSIYSFPTESEAYDAIVFLEVIEHLESPSSALKRLRDWLKPNGLLLLSTPNFDSLYRRIHGERWWVINCEEEHIMFFTPATLTRMLDKEGFDIEYLHIRSIDLAGIVQQARSSSDAESVEFAETANRYYQSRNTKQRIKSIADKLGLLNFIRMGLRGLDYCFSVKWSPVYAMGEQLVCIARKRSDGP